MAKKNSHVRLNHDTTSTSSVGDATRDNFETALDGLQKLVLEGTIDSAALEVLSSIPVIKNVAATLSIYSTVCNRFVAKKIAVFVDALQAGGGLDDSKLSALRDQYGDDRILEEVINRIDRLRSDVHAEIYANLYRATVDGHIGWDRFTQLADAVETLSVTDIDREDGKSDSGPSFVASGLAYVYYQTLYDSGRMVMAKNGEFFNDFWTYGLEPYKGRKKAATSSSA